MRSASTYRARRNRRTGRTSVSEVERRRLIQLGVSLMIFLLSLLGRNASPQRTELWNARLTGDINLRAALTRFEDSTARGEPFLDALGELCIEMVTAEGNAENGGSESNEVRQRSDLLKDASDWSARRRSWNAFRESQWSTG